VGKGRTNLPVPITSFIDAKVNSQRFGMPYRRPPGDSHRSRWRWQDTAVWALRRERGSDGAARQPVERPAGFDRGVL